MKHLILLLTLTIVCSKAYTQKDGIYRDLTLAKSEPEKVITLDLSNSGLTSVPVEIKEFKNMEGLFLQHNSIKTLPVWLSQNTSLRRLVLDDNKSIDLAKSLANIKGLELNYLSVQGCEILYFPLELQNYPSITSLNLANNEISDVPLHIMALINLKKLDLSHNHVANVSPYIWNCAGLQTLDLSDNGTAFNDTALLTLSALKNLEYVKLSNIKEQAFIDALKSSMLVLENTNINAKFPIGSMETPAISLKGSIISTDSRFTDNLATNTAVKKLMLNDCSFEGKCDFSKCKNLEELELTNTNFTNYASLIPLQKLKSLRIYNQKITAQQLNDLKKNLPGTSIYADVVTEYPFANGPVNDVNVPSQTVFMNAENENVFETQNVKLNFPENAFVDKGGNLVKGDVQIDYREFFDPISIAFSGINMRTDTNRNGSFMASAGMFEIKASQNGNEVFPNPQTEIMAQLKPVQTGDGFKQFSSTGLDWKVDEANVNFMPFTSQANFTLPPPAPNIFFEKVVFDLDGNPADFSFNFRPYNDDENHYNRTFRKQRTWVNYPEAGVTKKYKLQYKGDKGRYHFKQLDSINREVKGTAKWVKPASNDLPNHIEALTFVPDYTNDVMLMKFKYHGRNYEIPFIISEDNLSNAKVQEKTKTLYTSLNKANSQVKRDRATLAYEKDYKKYTKELELRQSSTDSMTRIIMRDRIEEDSTIAALGLSRGNLRLYTTFRVQGFGMSNCDKIIYVENKRAEDLMVEFKLEDSDEQPKKILLVNHSDNTCLAYSPQDNIKYDRTKRYSVIGVYDNHTIGTCTHKDFAEGKKTGKITLKEVSTKDKSLDELRAQL